jgi:hypothetical protein
MQSLVRKVACVTIITVASLARPEPALATVCIQSCCPCIPEMMCDNLGAACTSYCGIGYQPVLACYTNHEWCQDSERMIECTGP